jgi:hypothetical protein
MPIAVDFLKQREQRRGRRFRRSSVRKSHGMAARHPQSGELPIEGEAERLTARPSSWPSAFPRDQGTGSLAPRAHRGSASTVSSRRDANDRCIRRHPDQHRSGAGEDQAGAPRSWSISSARATRRRAFSTWRLSISLAVEHDDALAGGGRLGMGVDDSSRPFDFLAAWRKGEVGRRDLVRVDQGLAVEPQPAALPAGCAKPSSSDRSRWTPSRIASRWARAGSIARRREVSSGKRSRVGRACKSLIRSEVPRTSAASLGWPTAISCALRIPSGVSIGEFRGRSICCPRALARLRPSAVRVRIKSRSTSANPAATKRVSGRHRMAQTTRLGTLLRLAPGPERTPRVG